MLTALIINGILVLALLILGIILWRGKGAFLIAGYNTASPTEKAKYDEKALCRSVAVMLFAMAACYAVMALSAVFDRMLLHWIGLALFLIVTIAGMIYVNTSPKVKRK